MGASGFPFFFYGDYALSSGVRECRPTYLEIGVEKGIFSSTPMPVVSVEFDCNLVTTDIVQKEDQNI